MLNSWPKILRRKGFKTGRKIVKLFSSSLQISLMLINPKAEGVGLLGILELLICLYSQYLVHASGCQAHVLTHLTKMFTFNPFTESTPKQVMIISPSLKQIMIIIRDRNITFSLPSWIPDQESAVSANEPG